MTENRQAPEADRRGQAEEADRLAKQREYNYVWRANHPESSEQRDHRLAKQREYHRVRYANVEERRERDSRCLKPYPKSYRDRVLANYASKGLRVSQRMLDELDGNRDPHTPPLFRRA